MTELAAFVRDKLGHEPRDPKLFEVALTHKSVGKGDDYERLEFLGDRVLGCVIARALYERHPNEPEGYLSRRYNVLVARETCAEIGRVVSRTGAHHAPKFTIRVSVAGLGEATAEGTSKQEGETEAATALLKQLQ